MRIFNAVQPERLLYNRWLLFVVSLVVLTTEARPCDYFVANVTAPRKPTKRHALQISGIMRTLGAAYPKMRELLVSPNGMDVFAALVYDDHDRAQVDALNHFLTLPEVLATELLPTSSVNYKDRKDAMMKAHPDWTIWGEYLNRPKPKKHWLAVTTRLQAENYAATMQLRTTHEIMAGWRYDTVTRVRPDWDLNLPAPLHIEGIIRDPNTFYTLTCGSSDAAASDQFGLGSAKVMDEIAGMVDYIDSSEEYPGAGESVTTGTVLRANVTIELVSLLGCKALQLLPNAAIEAGITLYYNNPSNRSYMPLNYVVVDRGETFPRPSDCPTMAAGNKSIASFGTCSAKCDGAEIVRGESRVYGNYGTRRLKTRR